MKIYIDLVELCNIKRSLELDSENPLAWFYLAQICLEEEKVYEALNACHQSLKIYPQYKEALELRKKIAATYYLGELM